MSAVIHDCGFPSVFTKKMSLCLRKCKTRSLEKIVIRAVIFGVLGGSISTEMISANVQECLCDDSAEEKDAALSNEYEKSSGESNGEGGENGGARRMDKDSERRKRMYDLKRSGNVRRIFQRAEYDWNQVNENEKLVEAQRSVKRISKECVMKYLSFIFSREHRQLMTHGKMRIKTQDGDPFIFPKRFRTRIKRAIGRAYLEKKEGRSQVEKMSRRSVM